MEIPIQICHVLEVMRRDFNQHHMIQLPITENQLGTTKNMEEASEHVGLNYPETPDSTLWLNLFPCEEENGSAENPITIDED